MHPAFSVIFFTVGSGTGYGLLALTGFLVVAGLLPTESLFGLFVLGAGLGLVTVGLLSSTYHLGHRERALGAFTQWRTSWLSREGVISTATYLPVLLFLYAWYFYEGNVAMFSMWAVLTAISSLLTVFCTAMIYRSLAPIHQWCNKWTVPVYLGMGLAGGSVILLAFLRLFQFNTSTAPFCALLLLVLAWGLKVRYWRFIDTTHHQSTPESATGLGFLGQVRILESPHTEDNYLMTEMGYRIARKHANKLRRYVHLAGFALPSILVVLSGFLPGSGGAGLTVVAAISFLLGAIIERWLFFAEAKHTVTLYYGADRV